jgi:hypothetical protein
MYELAIVIILLLFMVALGSVIWFFRTHGTCICLDNMCSVRRCVY